MQDEHANLIIHGASVWTGNPLQPEAQAVVISGNRIVYVGKDEEALAWYGPATRLVNAQGKSILPGFIDSHYHLLLGAEQLDHLALDDVTTLAELREALMAYAHLHPEAEWINGVHLDYGTWSPGSVPRLVLDEVTPDRPVALMAFDLHTAWVNTAALQRAGALRGLETPPNSQIMTGEDGLATGELREPAAYGQVLRHADGWMRLSASLGGVKLSRQPDAGRERTALRKALKNAAREGITSVHNMDGNADQMKVYAALEDLGEMTLRIQVPFSVYPTTMTLALEEARVMKDLFASEMVRSGRVKFFMDGVIESWTALLREPYLDRPASWGEAQYSLEEFTQLAAECDRLGLQVSVHAIGDAAVERTLSGLEAVQALNGRHDSRHRIEHIELVRAEDLERFARLGVTASMQPLHGPRPWLEAGEPWLDRIAPVHWGGGFAWQKLRNAGARLVFGSDWPVVTNSVLSGLKAACTRQAWRPEIENQRQSLHDALLAYTRDAAFAEFQEDEKGVLKPGLLADGVMLSGNIEQTPPEEWESLRVEMTICDGKVVYEGD